MVTAGIREAPPASGPTAGMPITVGRAALSGARAAVPGLTGRAAGPGVSPGVTGSVPTSVCALGAPAPPVGGAFGRGAATEPGGTGRRAARSPWELRAATGVPHSPQNTTGPSHTVPHDGHLALGPLTQPTSPGADRRRS